MAEERKPIVNPRTPPPKPKRTYTETMETLHTLPRYVAPSRDYLAHIASPTGPPMASPPPVPPVPASPDYGTLSPTQFVRVHPLEGPPLPPRRNTSGSTISPQRGKSPRAQSTPKKGMLRNAYARAREFFTRKSESPYETIQQKSPAKSTSSTPKKKGIFRRLFGPSSPNPAANETMLDVNDNSFSSDPSTSRLDESNASGGMDLSTSSDVSLPYFPGDRKGSVSVQGVASAAASSNMSESDEDDGYARVGRRIGQVVSIQVNAPADIRVATTDDGQVTTCIKTASDRGKDA